MFVQAREPSPCLPKRKEQQAREPSPYLLSEVQIMKKALHIFTYTVLFSLILILAWVQPAPAATAVIKGNVVNVRQGPGTGYEIGGTLYQNTEVAILESKDGWKKIQHGSLNGWVAESLLQVKKEEMRLQVTADKANLRSGPSTSSSQVGQLRKGDSLILLDVEGEWYKVQIPGGSSAYIASFLVSKAATATNSSSTPAAGGQPETTTAVPASSPTPAITRQVEVISGPINIRSGPGESYPKLGSIDEKTAYPVISKEGEWYKIRLANGSDAYVAGWLVKESSMASSTVIPPATASGGAAGSSTAPRVFLDGQALSFEVPPIIENDRTLVPLRAIFEALGATVDWDNATRTVTSRKGSTTVVLTIGSLTPTVNGQGRQLDVPAKIVADRTLAPLRFVGEAFGSTVDWEGSTRTINIKSPPAPSAPSAGSSKKAVAVTVNKEIINLRSGPSTGHAQIDQARSGERMQVLAAQDGWYQVSRGGRIAWVSGEVVDVAWQENEPEAVPVTTSPGTPGNSPSELPPPTSPENIRILSSKDETGLKIIIGSGVELKGRLEESGNNLRYHFTGRSIEGNTIIRENIAGEILEVKAEQQGEDAVIYISIPANLKYRSASEEGGKKETITINNFITGIERKTFGSKGERIILKTVLPLDYSSEQQGTQMKIKLPFLLKGSTPSEYSFDSQLIQGLQLSESEVNGTQGMVLAIETKNPAKFAFGKSAEGNQLHILFVDQSDVQQLGSAIVIDPGHGGKETGTIGSWLKEKEPNLDISLKVAALLRQRGMEVVLTRDDDSYVSLEERADIANLYNARLFVSIHNNASLNNPAAQGSETHYYAPLDNPELFMQSAERCRLATCIQEQVVSKLRRMDRGVKTGPSSNFSVLRNTHMPSALVEVVFLSYDEEEQLLQQDYFRTLAAEAIADGITQYCGGSAEIKL